HESGDLFPLVGANPAGLWGGSRPLGDGLHLVRLAAVADRGVSPVADPRVVDREISLPSAYATREGKSVRVECSRRLWGRYRCQAQPGAEGLPQPGQDGIYR